MQIFSKKINYRLRLRKLIVGTILWSASVVLPANDGTLDTANFASPTGYVVTSFGGNDQCNAVAIQDDGKIVVVGTNGTDFLIARYTTAGVLDTTFNGTGFRITDIGGTDVANGVAIQSDGNIVVVGTNGSNFAVARYTTAGVLDTTFNGTGFLTQDMGNAADTAYAVAIQEDGKIVVAGFGGTGGDFAIARFTTTGVLDTTFNALLTGSAPLLAGTVKTNMGGAADTAYAVALQTNGNIVVAGTTGTNFALARYNTDGTLDTSFNPTATFGAAPLVVGTIKTDIGGTDIAYGVALQENGKIIAAGTNGTDFALARYNSDGSTDTTFNVTGIVTTDMGNAADVAYGVIIQPDGKIVAAGFGGTAGVFAVARYTTTGVLDSTFNPGLTGAAPTLLGTVKTDISGGTNDTGRTVALQSDGKIVVAGYTLIGVGNNDFVVARYFGEQVDSFISEITYCTECGPIALGNRGCERSLLYKVGSDVQEHLFYRKDASFVITSIEPTLYDFETTVTVLCESCSA